MTAEITASSVSITGFSNGKNIMACTLIEIHELSECFMNDLAETAKD